jgi:acylphosphatase
MPGNVGAAFRAVVTGRVQGVGYRYSAVREARSLGLLGTISNCSDGSVEVCAEGDPRRLQRFLDWLHKGPPGAHVRDVEVEWRPATGSHTDFEVEF